MTDLIVGETRRILKLLEQVEQFGNLRPPEKRSVNVHDLLDRARKSAQVGFAANMKVIEELRPLASVDLGRWRPDAAGVPKPSEERRASRWKGWRNDHDPHLLRHLVAAAPQGWDRAASASGRDHRRRSRTAARDRGACVRTLRFGARERHRAGSCAGVEDHFRPRRLDQREQRARAHGVPHLAARGAQGRRGRRGPRRAQEKSRQWMARFWSPTTTARSARF